jgi:hypothetical protein
LSNNVIPPDVQKQKAHKILNKGQFKLDWDGFKDINKYKVEPDNSTKRRIIVSKLNKYNIGISHVKISDELLESKGMEPVGFRAASTIKGITFARAYWDNTINTGEIKNAQPIVFDTVTGNSVTGINSKWSTSEYKVLGTALEDFNRLPETDADGKKYYKDYDNIILVKLEGISSITRNNVLLLNTSYRIPGRFIYNNKTYAGIGSAWEVNLELATVPITQEGTTYNNLWMEIKIEPGLNERKLVTVLNLGYRDIRPNAYIVAIPVGDSYVAVKEVY